MKKTTKITFSAIMAALAVAVMLTAYFPYLTYAIPAMAGLFIMAVVIELDLKWALGAYLSSAVLVFLFAEPESKLLYIFFFGYYPIIKAILEKSRKPLLEWLIKIIVFNAAVLMVYWGFDKVIGFSMDEFGELGKYGAYLLLVLGNAVFVLYDIAVSRIAITYMGVLHPKIKKIFK